MRSVKSNNFDPRKIAYVDGAKLNTNTPDSTTSVKITDYQDETIAANVNASGNNFLFLGDTYLPTGWKAYIDGNKTEIYKTNYGFMGIIVPKGLHKVEFNYAPTSFYISKYIALVLSSLVILGLIVTLLVDYKKRDVPKTS